MKQQRREIKLDTKLTDGFLDIKTLSAGAVLEHLDEQIALREMPIEKRFKKRVQG